ncbi:Exodeoxyribonuclease I [Bertholletia excelsa]
MHLFYRNCFVLNANTWSNCIAGLELLLLMVVYFFDSRGRKENLARAMEHESNGNTAAAYECYQKAVDISPSVAYELIQVLKQENVCYVVAPYEADAQMTFLAVSKQVDVVITEDSDLIAFGCPRIIYKMDKFGHGVEFQHSRLQQNKELNLTGFTKQMLLEMCILSGCDYLQSLPGMGLKRAHALMKRFKSYDKVIKHLRYNTVAVPPSYEESFKKAILTFLHQRVYDPTTEEIVHLSDLTDDVGCDLDFLGPLIPQHIAKGIASGDLDPFTKMPFEGLGSDATSVGETYQLKNIKSKDERKKLDLPVQKNVLTNYFYKGFASLEAKRRFKVPRSTPKDLNPVNKTSRLVEQVLEEAATCEPSCSPASVCDSPFFSAPSQEDHVNNIIVTKYTESSDSLSHDILGKERNPQEPLLQQSRHKELEEKSVLDADEGLTRTGDTKIISRSSYFQPKLAKDKDGENHNAKLWSEVAVASNKFRNIDPEWRYGLASAHKSFVTLHTEHEEKSALDADEGETRKEETKTIVRSPYFQPKLAKENDEDQNEKLGKENVTTDKFENINPGYEYRAVLYASENKTRTNNRKTIVRSSYFLHKSENEKKQDNGHRSILASDDLKVHTHQNAIPEITSGNGCFNSSIKKRKVAPVDSVQMDNTSSKCIRMDASFPIQKTNAEGGKFGCDISHLENYSGIAEKSMEKFVSVISSFRYSSSGSRASGLRAPLKDVHNTCTNRPNVAVDLSKFAYIPTNQNASSAHPRVRFG